MDPSKVVPERTSLWFSKEIKTVNYFARLFDKITVFICFCLAIGTFIIFWPLISTINFEEAFFTPLIPSILVIFESLGVVQEIALKILFIISLATATVGIYLLVKGMTKRQVPAIFAAVIYLVPPVPIFVLTFAKSPLLEGELASAKSFLTVIYGDGAHFLALALIPFTILFYLRFLAYSQKRDFLLVVLAAVAIFLTNRSQALYFGVILAIVTLTDMFIDRYKIKLAKMLLVLVFVVGLVSFWYTPSFWLEGTGLAIGDIGQNLKYLFPLPAIVAILSFLFSFVFFAKRRDRQPIFISFLAFFIFLSISIDWIINGRHFLPHPHRLLPVIFMFGAVVLSLTLTAAFDKMNLEKRLPFGNLPGWGKALGAFIFAAVSFVLFTILAYFVSPLVLAVVAGPEGIWTKLRINVIADRMQTLEIAGGKFLLAPPSFSMWEVVSGFVISGIFVLILLLIFIKDWQSKG